MELLTARYGNPHLAGDPGAKVRITVGAPRFKLPYKLAGSIPELFPLRAMWGVGESRFRDLYLELLEVRGGVEVIRARLEAIAAASGTDRLILLCFEKPGLFCHRQVFATWWRQQTSEVVPELPE